MRSSVITLVSIFLVNDALSDSNDYSEHIDDDTYKLITDPAVDIKFYPYIARVVAWLQKGLWSNHEKSFVCSGSIIHKYWIVTSGSCIEFLEENRVKENDVEVHTGSSIRGAITENIHIASTFLYHPDFQSSTYSNYAPFINDIGLIKVTEPMVNPSEGLIALANSPLKDISYIIGWGMINPANTEHACKNLRYAVVAKLEYSLCYKYYRGAVENQHICIAFYAACPNCKKNFCVHDVGGPLVFNNTLIGIMSSATFCKNGVSLFTSIIPFKEWIYGEISRN